MGVVSITIKTDEIQEKPKTCMDCIFSRLEKGRDGEDGLWGNFLECPFTKERKPLCISSLIYRSCPIIDIDYND